MPPPPHPWNLLQMPPAGLNSPHNAPNPSLTESAMINQAGARVSYHARRRYVPVAPAFPRAHLRVYPAGGMLAGFIWSRQRLAQQPFLLKSEKAHQEAAIAPGGRAG